MARPRHLSHVAAVLSNIRFPVLAQILPAPTRLCILLGHVKRSARDSYSNPLGEMLTLTQCGTPRGHCSMQMVTSEPPGLGEHVMTLTN